MTGVVLDAGALVAIDRGDRAIGAMLRVAWELGVPVRTSAAAVAQVWRSGSRQARLARVLSGVDSAPLDLDEARAIGTLLARNASADVVDAHVARLVHPGDRVLTSDPDDIAALLRTREVEAAVVRV